MLVTPSSFGSSDETIQLAAGLAVDHVNRSGGVDGAILSLEVVGGDASASVIATRIEEVAMRSNLVAVVLAEDLSTALGQGILMAVNERLDGDVLRLSLHPRPREFVGAEVYFMQIDALSLGTSVARFMISNGWGDYSAVVPRDATARIRGFVVGLWGGMRRRGGALIQKVAITVGGSASLRPLSRLSSSQDVIVVALDQPVGLRALEEIRSNGVNEPAVTGVEWDEVDLTGTAPIGELNVVNQFCSIAPRAHEFVSTLERQSRRPRLLDALAYDAVVVAAQLTRSDQGGGRQVGLVTGDFSFSPDRTPVDKELSWARVDSSGVAYVGDVLSSTEP